MTMSGGSLCAGHVQADERQVAVGGGQRTWTGVIRRRQFSVPSASQISQR